MDGVAITQLGVAGAVVAMALYILKLLVDGKLHTQSELDARDRQIKELLEINRRLNDALEAANGTMSRIIETSRHP